METLKDKMLKEIKNQKPKHPLMDMTFMGVAAEACARVAEEEIVKLKDRISDWKYVYELQERASEIGTAQNTLNNEQAYANIGDLESPDFDALLEKHLHKFTENNLFRASLLHFVETGKASGSWRSALIEMVSEVFEQRDKRIK